MLADWAAWYDGCGQKRYRKTNEKTDFDDVPIESEDELNDDEIFSETSNVISKSIKKQSQARIIRSVWCNTEAQPEKHFCELLMLFTPWRNEVTDLLRNYPSYEEHYTTRRDEISEQIQQYAICSKDLNAVGNRLQECDGEAYDTLATVTHPDLNETFDHLSDNLGIPSTQQDNEPLILNEMPDDDYQGLLQMLDKKQSFSITIYI